jgi:alpha-amylase/alpha-mannosidase (GH57 family)
MPLGHVECFKHGAEVYQQLVKTAQISMEQVAAHYAISSLFTSYAKDHQIYCYTANQLDYQLQRMGSLTLAIGQLQLVSDITRESTHLVFAVVHLGGWDFHCCIQSFAGRRAYADIKDQLFESIKQASAAQTILAMNALFGNQSHSLQSLFAEERHRIMHLLTHETLTRLDQLYTQVYRDNYGVLMAFHRDELAVPRELQVAAEIALSHRVLLALRALEQESSDLCASPAAVNRLLELEAIATEAAHLHCQLNLPEARQTLERLVLRSLWHLLYHFDSATSTTELQRLERLLVLSEQLQLGLSLAQAQELYFQRLHSWIIPECVHWLTNAGQVELKQVMTMQLADLRSLLTLGRLLAVDVSGWLKQLP